MRARSGPASRPRRVSEVAVFWFGLRFVRDDVDATQRLALGGQIHFARRHLVQLQDVGDDRRRVVPAQRPGRFSRHRFAKPVEQLADRLAAPVREERLANELRSGVAAVELGTVAADAGGIGDLLTAVGLRFAVDAAPDCLCLDDSRTPGLLDSGLLDSGLAGLCAAADTTQIAAPANTRPVSCRTTRRPSEAM